VASQDVVDESALKRLGARATVKVSSNALQVVLGPVADQVADEIRTLVRRGAGDSRRPEEEENENRRLKPAPRQAAKVEPALIAGLLEALGGPKNVNEIEAVASSRLRIRVADGNAIDESAIVSLGLRGIARPAPDRVHVLIGPAAPHALELLRVLLDRPA